MPQSTGKVFIKAIIILPSSSLSWLLHFFHHHYQFHLFIFIFYHDHHKSKGLLTIQSNSQIYFPVVEEEFKLYDGMFVWRTILLVWLHIHHHHREIKSNMKFSKVILCVAGLAGSAIALLDWGMHQVSARTARCTRWTRWTRCTRCTRWSPNFQICLSLPHFHLITGAPRGCENACYHVETKFNFSSFVQKNTFPIMTLMQDRKQLGLRYWK